MPAVPMLKASVDFQRLSREGKRWSGPAFIMQSAPSPGGFRLGLTASRKVGNAVVRNRAKRRLRELVRLFLKEHALSGLDLVLIAKTAAASQDFARLNEDFRKGLAALGVRA